MIHPCDRWVNAMPKAAVDSFRDEHYALVLGPLVNDSDRGKLGDEDFEYLKSKAGAIVTRKGDQIWASYYDHPSTLAEAWAETTGEWVECEECGKCLCICPILGLGEGSPPWG